MEGRFTTWNTRFKTWKNDPAAATFPVGGKTVVTAQEGEINFEDMNDLSFASISFPVNYDPNNNNFNASIFYNKLANTESSVSLLVTFQFAPTLFGNTLALESYESDLDLEIDEDGFGLAKSLFKDKLMVGASISVLLLDLESTFSTNFIGSNGFDHDPSNAFSSGNQLAVIYKREKDVAFRFGALYRITDKLTIAGSAQIMPEFDYDTEYIAFLDSNSNVLPNFTDRSGLSVPDVFSIGLSCQITDKWMVSAEGRYIEYSDLEKGFVSFWGTDLTSFDRNQFDIADIWETNFGTEYIFNLKKMPIALRLGGFYEPAHSLEFDAILDPTDLLPNIDVLYEDLIDGGDDVFHFTAGAGTVINNKLQIDAAADIQDDGNQMTFVMSGIYKLF
ncbi:MAG: outer membrane protein transport protein [Candidatus Scalindua sp.]|nr:outer membrane protein transport protein [Candidatus Scalindua sp.]